MYTFDDTYRKVAATVKTCSQWQKLQPIYNSAKKLVIIIVQKQNFCISPYALFAKLRKATTSYVMSIRHSSYLSVRPHENI